MIPTVSKIDGPSFSQKMEYTISFITGESRIIVLPSGTFRFAGPLMYDGPLSADDFCGIVPLVVENYAKVPSVLAGFFDKYAPRTDDYIITDETGSTLSVPKEAIVNAAINLPAFLEAIASGDSFVEDKSIYSHLFPMMIPKILARVTRPEFIQQVLTIITTSDDDEEILKSFIKTTKTYLTRNGHADLIESVNEACTDAIARRMD